MAWSDRPWVLDGAAVRVSMIGFDDGSERAYTLDGHCVDGINPDLTSKADLTTALRLSENGGLCFIGTKKAGSFDIDNETATELLNASPNPSQRLNSDVVLQWISGQAITKRTEPRWIIYFGEMSEAEASLYLAPFEYVRKHVWPERQHNNEQRARVSWWQHRRPATEMWSAVSRLSRYIATVRHSKYRLFVWCTTETIPDDGLYVFSREDDYFFGVLQARPHELWALRQGSSLEDRPRYTPTSTFDTYPFPWPPAKEPQDDPRVLAIADAAKELVELRNAWLNPPGLSEKELQKRTLTNLYNERPGWLEAAHGKLDAAVFEAYGWPQRLSDEEILARLLALNQKRAGTLLEPDHEK